MKSQSESSFLAGLRAERAEKILEVDGTLTTQPILEHVGISAWPGLFYFLSFHTGLPVPFLFSPTIDMLIYFREVDIDRPCTLL